MESAPPDPLVPTTAIALPAGAVRHLHPPAGTRLVLASGRADIVVTAWLAERMVAVTVPLAAGECHACGGEALAILARADAVLFRLPPPPSAAARLAARLVAWLRRPSARPQPAQP